MPRRLLLADDHPLILQGLFGLLADEFDIVGTAGDGRSVVEKVAELKPSIVVLDIGMPGLNGIEAARRISKLSPAPAIVFITQHLDPSYLQAAFTAGAKAYVAKQSAPKELIEAIHCVMQGRVYVTPLIRANIAGLHAPDSDKDPTSIRGNRLTPRQREVLQLVAEGKTSKEISATLKISQKTVEFHRNSLMDELGLRTIAELTRYALSQGIVT